MSEKSPNGGSVNDAATNDQTGSTAAFSPGDLLASWAAETDSPEAPPSTAAPAAAAPAITQKPAVSITPSLKPRSHRALKMGISLPVEVQHPTGAREQSQTVFVLARGAVISLTNAVIVGQKLTLKNLKNGKVVECRVLSVERGLKGTNQVELEFTEIIPEFWPVHFPSEDYGASESRQSQPAPSTLPSSARPDLKPVISAPAIKHPTTPSVSPSLETPAIPSKPVELVPLAGSLAGQQKVELIPAIESSGARNKTPLPGTISASDVRAADLAASSIDHKAAQRKTPVPGTHTVNDFRRAEVKPPVELKVRNTPLPGAFTTADVHAMELKGSGVEIKVRNTPVPGTHHVNDFRISEVPVARPHTSTVYSPSQHRHVSSAPSGGGMKWIILSGAVVAIAAGALFAPKFLFRSANTHTEAAVTATPALAEKLTTSQPAAATPEPSQQNAQPAAPTTQPELTATEVPKSEPKLEIREANTETKPEPKTEARSETKSSAPTPTHAAPTSTHAPPATTHAANAKPTKNSEPEPQELAVVKQSGAAPASHKQAPANDEPEPTPNLPDAGSGLVANSEPPAVLSGIVAPASPVAAPRAVSHITAPRLITSAPPVYPAIAKQNRIQGDVTIDMEIDVNGNVSSAKVLSGPPFLQAAAKDAVHRWKYEPATLNDNPIPYHIQVRVHFALQ